MPKISRKILWAFIIIATIGFADATYLAFEYYTGSVPPCSLTDGCETVTTSEYSTIFGISVALLGSLYYLTLLVLAMIYKDTLSLRIAGLAGIFTVLGLGMSIWFTYLQFFVLKALCPYCLFSALTSTALFVLSAIVFREWKKQSAKPSQISPSL